jgi:hypothetical protein
MRSEPRHAVSTAIGEDTSIKTHSSGERTPPVRRNLSAALRSWHQRAGLAAFFFLGWLGISGILLNEASDLGLNGIRVSWPWLMAIYGLHAAPPQNGFLAGSHWLASASHSTFLDGHALASDINTPLGMASASDGHQETVYVATPSSVVLLDARGGRIDELRDPPLPVTTVRAVGTVSGHGNTIAVRDDSSAYQSTDGGETWTQVRPNQVSWSDPQPLSSKQQDQLAPYSRPSVAVQQVLVDAHSGRLFGRYGTYVIDLVGLTALLLATSGMWMYIRTQSRKKQAARVSVPTLRRT